jgi:hypothetical protein
MMTNQLGGYMPVNVYNHETKTSTPTYVGLVVSLFEENGSWDSDFFAMVWNAETKSLNRVMYDTTRGAMNGSASVDATPEIFAEVEKMRERNRARYESEKADCLSRVAEKGSNVLIKGIKGKHAVLNDAKGVVFWKGPDRFSKYDIRIGVEIDGNKHFLNGHNVFVSGSNKSAHDAEVSWGSFERVAIAFATHVRGAYY